VVTVTAAMVGVITVALWCAFAAQLPPLIDGIDTSLMTRHTRQVVVPLMLLVLVVTARGTWNRTGPERWVSVAVLACICDLALTFASGSRYSVGWYAGRSMIVVATGVVLAAMLASFSRIKAQAERDAFHDPLTHLLNRRGAFATLDAMILRARSSGYPLGVITLDLDLFKTINDVHGDRVLVEVGRVLNTCSRAVDVSARIGGEEFLVILDDTDDAEVQVAAQRLRGLIAEVIVPGIRIPVTASIGVTVLEQEDHDRAEVLRRADGALFDAKRNGRNRVESRFLGSSAHRRHGEVRLAGS
jgi:diguanylate cyclase (GGDEF)-like protein